jgi:hypothetical protein
MRYRLRTLLIVLAVGPPVLAIGWWAFAFEEAPGIICTIAFAVIAVWLGSRAVIYLNTRM